MPEINARVVCHYLITDSAVRPVAQRNYKVGKEKRLETDDEVEKLKDVGSITEIKYPTWLASMVLVHKALNKWRMWVDFTNMNVKFPKDLYQHYY